MSEKFANQADGSACSDNGVSSDSFQLGLSRITEKHPAAAEPVSVKSPSEAELLNERDAVGELESVDLFNSIDGLNSLDQLEAEHRSVHVPEPEAELATQSNLDPMRFLGDFFNDDQLKDPADDKRKIQDLGEGNSSLEKSPKKTRTSNLTE